MKLLINFLLLVLALFILVFPNAYQVITGVLLIAITVFIFFHYRYIIIPRYFIIAWFIISLVFLFFIFISNIELKFKAELFLKYILFPYFWLTVFSYLKANFTLKVLSRTLFHYSVLCLVSVIALYLLMLNGHDYSEYFISSSNIDSDFLLGFSLHVYGNLIFFAAGLFILPNIYSHKLIIYLYIIAFIAVVLISGRTALLMSLVLGIFFLLSRYLFTGKYVSVLAYILSFIVIIFVARYYVLMSLNSDIFDYFKAGSVEKLKTFGGEERTAQFDLMASQILQNPWGIGFSNIGIERNEQRTFDYEVLILATVLRFGILGFCLICFTIFPVARNIFYLNKIDVYRKFYLAGFFSIIIFSFTNPYLESFNFQWMFFCPLVFLSDFSPLRVVSTPSSLQGSPSA